MLDKKCPALPASYVALLGPFESGHAAFEACNLMTRDRVTQTEGTFSWRKSTKRDQNRVRGEECMFECNGCHTCKVIFEEAGDGAYYLRFAATDHKPGCLKPQQTVAEKRATGDMWVSKEYVAAAKKYGKGLPTKVVNRMLHSAAAIDGVDITWWGQSKQVENLVESAWFQACYVIN
jgi:hypothetical protein